MNARYLGQPFHPACEGMADDGRRALAVQGLHPATRPLRIVHTFVGKEDYRASGPFFFCKHLIRSRTSPTRRLLLGIFFLSYILSKRLLHFFPATVPINRLCSS
mmetsp:Transcript_67621/g.113322  ORF Transcript_67621/g.113322 Transcript_67621/m.113322 type:complete len:104 (-) Transcript_67621:346-657(-)